ncbi:MAG: aminotransferase class III-fold pyridoxal phosphate-dependent enzyme [Bacillota bacterium]
MAKEKAAAAFSPGDHASTFGGNPLACTTALATLEYMLENGVVENAARVGAYFKERLLELAGRFPFVREVRGLGLLLGMELAIEGAPIVTRCRERGLLLNCVDSRILRSRCLRVPPHSIFQ